MTFNIHHGEGTDGQLDLVRIAKLIDMWRPEVVGLQEVDRRFGARSALADQASWLARTLRMSAWYGPAMTIRDSGGLREYGNAVLSREPLTARDWTPLPCSRSARSVEPRCVVRGRHSSGTEIWVTHLSNVEPGERADQAQAIVDAWRRNPRPTVLLGDLNAPPGEAAVTILGEVFVDAWPALRSEPGYTYSTDRPTRRIDYVFTTSDIRAVRVDLADAGAASDHHAVVADLLVTTNGRHLG